MSEHRETLIQNRASGAALELLEGKDVTFEDYPTDRTLKLDDIVTRTFEDDDLNAAFLEMIHAHPDSELRKLFDKNLAEETRNYAEEEREYIDSIRPYSEEDEV